MNKNYILCIQKKIEKEVKERWKHSLQTQSRMLLILSWLFLPLCIFKAQPQNQPLSQVKEEGNERKNFFFSSFYVFKMKVRKIRPKWCKNIPEATKKKNKNTDSRQSISVGIYACHHLAFSVNPLTFIMIQNCWRDESDVGRRKNRQYEWRYIKCGVMRVDAVWDKEKRTRKKRAMGHRH